MYIYVFEVQLPTGLSKVLYDQTGSEKTNLAAFKPEVLKSSM